MIRKNNRQMALQLTPSQSLAQNLSTASNGTRSLSSVQAERRSDTGILLTPVPRRAHTPLHHRTPTRSPADSPYTVAAELGLIGRRERARTHELAPLGLDKGAARELQLQLTGAVEDLKEGSEQARWRAMRRRHASEEATARARREREAARARELITLIRGDQKKQRPMTSA